MRKIIGIFFITLLIGIALTASGIMNEKTSSKCVKKDIIQQNGVDQEQTSQCGRGYNILPSQWLAQGFKPSTTKLTAVQLYLFKHDSPSSGIKITVSIRDTINGSDLTSISVNADQIDDYKWVSFDFPDIDLIADNTYYIVCRSDGGEGDNVYCWFYDNDNLYDRGDGWISLDVGLTWSKPKGMYANDIDFCFKTWYTTSKNKQYINRPLFNLLENHPILYNLLQRVLKY
jgi:hypothetical protein